MTRFARIWSQRPCTTAEDIERFYLCFLARLFSKTKDELEGGRAKQQKGTKTLAAWWRDHLRQPDVRPQLYSSVVDEAEGFTAETVSLMSCAPYMWDNNLNDHLAQVDVAARKAKDAFKELSVTIDSFNQSPAPAPKITLYFDEADTPQKTNHRTRARTHPTNTFTLCIKQSLV
jgi:hypothetical protein